MIGIGDEVVCIFPGNGTGPDCKVGKRFIVKDIRPCVAFTGAALVFDIHPYADEYGIHPGARAWRFAKANGLEDASLKKEVVLIKANA